MNQNAPELIPEHVKIKKNFQGSRRNPPPLQPLSRMDKACHPSMISFLAQVMIPVADIVCGISQAVFY